MELASGLTNFNQISMLACALQTTNTTFMAANTYLSHYHKTANL